MVYNMDAAVEFYVEKLEFKLVNRYADHYAEVQAPGLMIGLHPASEKVIFGNNLSIGIGAVKFEETIKYFESKGIEFVIEQMVGSG